MTRKECLEQAMGIVEDMKDYESLVQVYQDAVIQASKGKGRERHAEDGEAYENQIICEVARRVGLGYPLGQAVKKVYESQRLGGERGVAELLGALNYVAAAVIVMREGLDTAPKAEGCEALVERDAPQTKEELFNRIVDCNPSVYLRKPTGEELAEMAEEEPHV